MVTTTTSMMMTTTTMMMIFEKLRPKNAIPRGLPPHNISFHTTKSFGEKANSALNIAATWFSSDIASPVVVHTQFRVECWFLSYGQSYIFRSDENHKSYNAKRDVGIGCFFYYSTFVQTSALSSPHNIAKQCQKKTTFEIGCKLPHVILIIQTKSTH